MLAAGAPKQVAFMADESMLAFSGLQPIKYDLSFYREYLKRVNALVKELNKKGNYCPFNITGEDIFAKRFILNENILFWLTIFYQKPFVFSVSVFCSQICTLWLNLQPEIGLTYAISIVK